VARLAALIEAAAMARRPFLLGCPGGRSPKPIYLALAHQIAERDLSLSEIKSERFGDAVRRGEVLR
jgi:glucosamine-6-phosphate deaminase